MYEWTSLDHVAPSETYEPTATPSIGLAARLLPHQLDQPRPRRQHLVSARNTWTVYDVSGPAARSAGVSGASTAATRRRHPRAPRGSTTRANCPTDRSACSTTAPLQLSKLSRAGSCSNWGRAGRPAQPAHAWPAADRRESGQPPGARQRELVRGLGPGPDFSEFGPSGALLFDAHLPTFDQSYRSFRFTWVGSPRTGRRSPSSPGRRVRGRRTRAGTARRSSPPGGCSPAPPRRS